MCAIIRVKLRHDIGSSGLRYVRNYAWEANHKYDLSAG